MINNTIVPGTTITNPTLVFTSSTTGAPLGGAVTGQTSAITTIILCNTLTPDLSDETVNSARVNIYLVSPNKGGTVGQGTLVVSNLTVPAGETVFFSEERIVLDAGDQIWVGSSGTDAITVTVSSLPV
jgi:hypothetical protein